MSKLYNAVHTAMNTTENGCLTHGSTLNACLDLFATIGASRGKNITPLFAKAFGEDPKTAMQILFWARDIRGGAGERQLFRDNVLSVVTPENVIAVIAKTVELGRWDDLHVFLGTRYEDLMVSFTADALETGHALTAKWQPRKGDMFNLLRKKMGKTPKELRKLLVTLSNTVEQKMSAKEWSEIDYEKLPSLASSRYMTAFHRNDATRYQAYKDALDKGVAKINAGAVYPYDIIKGGRYSGLNWSVANAQWNALPDYMQGKRSTVIPVIDVSGSMGCPVGGNPNLTCLDVAVSLGLYVAERNQTEFKDQFITFSENPQLQKVTGTLQNRLSSIYTAQWGMNTNINGVFDLILNAAKKHGLTQADLPEQILIFSDMEFDRCAMGAKSATAFDAAKQKFEAAGYTLPQLVFWNLNSRGDKNFPVQQHQTGALLVSGFSPALLKSVVGGVEHNPVQMMMEVVNVPRYTI